MVRGIRAGERQPPAQILVAVAIPRHVRGARRRTAAEGVETMDETVLPEHARVNSRVDVITLAKLAAQIERDAKELDYGINPAAMRSVAEIIKVAIGAPLMTDIRTSAAEVADTIFPSDNQARHAFNWGVAWAVSQLANCRQFRYRPTDRPEP